MLDHARKGGDRLRARRSRPDIKALPPDHIEHGPAAVLPGRDRRDALARRLARRVRPWRPPVPAGRAVRGADRARRRVCRSRARRHCGGRGLGAGRQCAPVVQAQPGRRGRPARGRDQPVRHVHGQVLARGAAMPAGGGPGPWRDGDKGEKEIEKIGRAGAGGAPGHALHGRPRRPPCAPSQGAGGASWCSGSCHSPPPPSRHSPPPPPPPPPDLAAHPVGAAPAFAAMGPAPMQPPPGRTPPVGCGLFVSPASAALDPSPIVPPAAGSWTLQPARRAGALLPHLRCGACRLRGRGSDFIPGHPMPPTP